MNILLAMTMYATYAARLGILLCGLLCKYIEELYIFRFCNVLFIRYKARFFINDFCDFIKMRKYCVTVKNEMLG